MDVLGYWLAIYVTVVLEEHFIFRKGNFANYDLEAWNHSSMMPIGWAAMIAGCFGVAGAVVGMGEFFASLDFQFQN